MTSLVGEGKYLMYCFSRCSNLALPDKFLHSVIQEIFTVCILWAGHWADYNGEQARKSPWPGSIGGTVMEMVA